MFVLREAVHLDDGGVRAGDFLSMPFRARKGMGTEKGQMLDWAESALFRPAAALAAKRLVALELLDPKNEWQRDTFIRGVRTVCELPKVMPDGTDVELVIGKTLLAVALSGVVNQRRQHKLNKAHWMFAYRVVQWFAVTTTGEHVKDTTLTKGVYNALKNEGLRMAAKVSA